MKLPSLLILVAVNFSVVLAQPARRSVPVRNRAINNIVREIDARNIEATIRKLVSFGTRSTLSEQNDPKRGIGAARDWLYSEVLKAAESSQGRMTVEKQSFEQQKAARVPQPTMLTMMWRFRQFTTGACSINFFCTANPPACLLGSAIPEGRPCARPNRARARGGPRYSW